MDLVDIGGKKNNFRENLLKAIKTHLLNGNRFPEIVLKLQNIRKPIQKF